MNDETPAGRGLENSAGGRVPTTQITVPELVRGVLRGNLDVTTLPPLLWDLWADGFRAGSQRASERLQPQLDNANREADLWYAEATHSPDELRELRLQAMDEGWRAYWDAGMPTGVPA